VLKDWRVESQVLELSTNLDGHSAAESQRFNAESCRTVMMRRTTSILMTSWPGKWRSICSKISMGSSAKRGVDADIVLR